MAIPSESTYACIYPPDSASIGYCLVSPFQIFVLHRILQSGICSYRTGPCSGGMYSEETIYHWWMMMELNRIAMLHGVFMHDESLSLKELKLVYD